MTQLYLARFMGGKWYLKKISDWDFRWKFFEGGDQMTMGADFDLAGISDEGLMAIDWATETGESGRYTIDLETLEHVRKVVKIIPKYPDNIHERMTDMPGLSVRLVDDKGGVQENDARYVLKWESMAPSHGRHAPAVIPEGPLSQLLLLKIN